MALNTFLIRRVLLAMVMLTSEGCQSLNRTQTVLSAPVGTNAAANHHNDEGMRAYQQKQWDKAKQHFEEAIASSPELAEAHYNLGMTLYRLQAIREGDTHFIEAANLAPGNTVIWDAPPLRGVTNPEKNIPNLSSDGHGH